MDTARNKYVDKFCKQLSDFVNKLDEQYPEINDIAILNTIIQGILMANQKDFLIGEYKKFVYPYKKLVDTKDEDALLNSDLSGVLEHIKKDEIEEGKIKIEYFKGIFKSPRTTMDTKKACWEYLTLLNKLIEKISSFD